LIAESEFKTLYSKTFDCQNYLFLKKVKRFFSKPEVSGTHSVKLEIDFRKIGLKFKIFTKFSQKLKKKSEFMYKGP
jgi:hypothetical protein